MLGCNQTKAVSNENKVLIEEIDEAIGIFINLIKFIFRFSGLQGWLVDQGKIHLISVCVHTHHFCVAELLYLFL